jgi:Family of unknown function (DUF6624)
MKLMIPVLNKLISTALGQAIFGVALAKNKQLCAELLWMAYRDQKARKAWARSGKYHTVEHLKQAIQLDLSHTRRMKQIIAKHGWPGQTLVGDTGCQAAWLLIQHADHDPEFQKHCLRLLEGALETKEAPASCLAYLIDRIRVGDGQPQLFGTQLHGDLNPLPIEDEAHVDERRAEVGLPPLSDYIGQIKQAMMHAESLPDRVTEMKQLLSKLPPSPEYDNYVAQMKRLLNTM